MAQRTGPTAGEVRVSEDYLRWQAGAWEVVAGGAHRIAEDAERVRLGARGGGSASDPSESAAPKPAAPQEFQLFGSVAAESSVTADRVADLARQAERVSRDLARTVTRASATFREDRQSAVDILGPAGVSSGGRP